MELDEDLNKLFSNKNIKIISDKNKLIINIDSRKILIPEIINEYDFRDIQIAEMRKIINSMNDKFLLMYNKIEELETKNKLLTDKLSDNIFFEGAVLPVSVDTNWLILFCNDETYGWSKGEQLNIYEYLIIDKNKEGQKIYDDISRDIYGFSQEYKYGSPMINFICSDNLYNIQFLKELSILTLINDPCCNTYNIYKSDEGLYIDTKCNYDNKCYYSINGSEINGKCSKINNLDKIKYLENLKELTFNCFCDCIFKDIDFSDNKLFNLTDIIFKNSHNDITDISFLKHFKSLESVSFENTFCDIVNNNKYIDGNMFDFVQYFDDPPILWFIMDSCYDDVYNYNYKYDDNDDDDNNDTFYKDADKVVNKIYAKYGKTLNDND
jgi:hypothetical protein